MRQRRDRQITGEPGSDGPSARIDKIRSLLGRVEDPVLFHDLEEIGTLRQVELDPDGTAHIVVAVPFEDYPGAAQLEDRLARALGAELHQDGFQAPDMLRVTLVTMDEPELAELAARMGELDSDLTGKPRRQQDSGARGGSDPVGNGQRRKATRVIVVASGKGGVGKSSVTVNLAVALARRGLSVGLLDADIYGFSVPAMLGISSPPITLGKVVIPAVAHGVRCISMGFFVEEDRAVAWRGPMLHKALEQFLGDVHWGSPDILLVDMPPGTGDVALSVAQQLPGAEMVVVTTPQPAAQRVAQRAGVLARQLRLPLRGVIENMSYFEAPDGARYEIFGAGGGALLSESLGVPLLAQIPLVREVRVGADEGRPALVADPGGTVAQAFEALADRVAKMSPARVYRSELSIATSAK